MWDIAGSVFPQMLCQFSQILEQSVIRPLLPENAVWRNEKFSIRNGVTFANS
jgi:hypothetical protein